MKGTTLFGVLAVLCAFIGTLNAVALDAACTKDSDCSCTNAYATCQSALCKCASGYTASGSSCLANLGTACTADGDCVTTTGTVCDTTEATPVCKLGSGADCTSNTNMCVKNSACSSNLCTCTASTHTAASNLCKLAAGQTCTAHTDCATGVCDLTVASPTCKVGHGDACTADSDCVSQATCPSSTCDCATTHPDATSKLCLGNKDSACVNDAGCLTNGECTSQTCACKTGYLVQSGDASCLGDYGATCTADGDCDTATNTDAFCDTASQCKKKAGSTCTAGATSCTANSACDGSNCVCSTDYTQDGSTPTACLGEVGKSCTTNADCDQQSGSLYCDVTLTSPVCRKALADCTADATTCVGNSGCSGGSCTCSSGYTEDGILKLCLGAVDSACDVDGDCGTNMVCDSTSNTCKMGIGQTCTANQCMTNAECSTCTTCLCSTGYTYSTTNAVCESSSATAAVYSTLMLMICFLMTRV